MTIETTITTLMKRSFNEMMKSVATSITGHVLAFDPVKQLAQIQIGVKRVDLNGESYIPSPLIEVPVYQYGGDYCVEHQIDVGTEGLILFSQRCIQEWINHGKVADNPIARFHNINDAVFICGVRSQPNALKPFTNNGVRLRNKDASHYMWLKNDGTQELSNGNGKITLLPDGTVNINGVIIDTSGNITAPAKADIVGAVTAASATVTGDVKAGGKSVMTHTHGGVMNGGGVTGLPI